MWTHSCVAPTCFASCSTSFTPCLPKHHPLPPSIPSPSHSQQPPPPPSQLFLTPKLPKFPLEFPSPHLERMSERTLAPLVPHYLYHTPTHKRTPSFNALKSTFYWHYLGQCWFPEQKWGKHRQLRAIWISHFICNFLQASVPFVPDICNMGTVSLLVGYSHVPWWFTYPAPPIVTPPLLHLGHVSHGLQILYQGVNKIFVQMNQTIYCLFLAPKVL